MSAIKSSGNTKAHGSWWYVTGFMPIAILNRYNNTHVDFSLGILLSDLTRLAFCTTSHCADNAPSLWLPGVLLGRWSPPCHVHLQWFPTVSCLWWRAPASQWDGGWSVLYSHQVVFKLCTRSRLYYIVLSVGTISRNILCYVVTRDYNVVRYYEWPGVFPKIQFIRIIW